MKISPLKLSDADKDLLKTVLGIPTYTNHEGRLVMWLQSYCEQKGYAVTRDTANNLYVTKGHADSNANFYPCVSAHTDSVHPLVEMEIREHSGCLTAHSPETGDQIGLGGDDKAGVFICLKMLEMFPNIKATFFTGEEQFCIGSHQLQESFFDDVGYHAAFDSPCDDIITWVCNGIQLFDFGDSFFEAIRPILESHDATRYQKHPYTDSFVVKSRFDFACINLPAAYFNMHSSREYVRLSSMAKCLSIGESIIRALGEVRYYKKAHSYTTYVPENVRVTGLQMSH